MIKALVASAAHRLLFVHINRWRMNTLMRANLGYALSLEVLDERGARLARSVASGRAALGSGGFDPDGFAAAAGPERLRKLLALLFADPAVAAALASATGAAAPIARPPVNASPIAASPSSSAAATSAGGAHGP